MRARNLVFLMALAAGCGSTSRGTPARLDGGTSDLSGGACKSEGFACSKPTDCCAGLTCTNTICINPQAPVDLAMNTPKPDFSMPQGGSHMAPCDEQNPNYGTACDQCFMDAQTQGGGCYTALQACGADTGCGAAIRCMNACAPGDTTCLTNCIKAQPAKSQMLLQALFVCLDQTCPTCLVDADCGGGMTCTGGLCK